MATAFVTGATGFVGQHLVRYLLSLKWRVICVARNSAYADMLQALGAQVYSGDVTNRDTLLSALPVATDVVFHLAAERKLPVDKDGEISEFNERTLRSMIFASVEKRSRCFVFMSDALVYGFSNVAFDETHGMPDANPAALPSAYVQSKRACESIVKRAVARGLDAVILNPGPILHMEMPITPAMTMKQFLDGTTKVSSPAGSRCFVDIDTVIKSLLAVAERGQVGQNYLIGGPSLTWHNLLTLLASLNQSLPPEPPLWLKSLNFSALTTHLSKYFKVMNSESYWLNTGVQDFVNLRAEHSLAVRMPDKSAIHAVLSELISHHKVIFTQS